jgi:2-dehydropantoate 2-reductase
VARAYLPRLAPDGFFITVQNGLIALDLARILGADRIVPGCLMWGGVMDAPGEYRLTAEGMTIVGSLSGNKDRAQAAASVISAVSPVSISGNIEGVLWSKLAITASLTSLGAIGGVGFGRLVLKSRMRRLILSIGREVRDVAVATGVRLEPLGDGFDVPWLLAHDGYPNAIRHMVIVILGWKHRRTTPGMLVSLQRKQRTEVEHINGRVVAIGSAAGIAVPLNRAITDLLLEMDGGRRMPGPEALAVLEYSARAPMPPQARGSHES